MKNYETFESQYILEDLGTWNENKKLYVVPTGKKIGFATIRKTDYIPNICDNLVSDMSELDRGTRACVACVGTSFDTDDVQTILDCCCFLPKRISAEMKKTNKYKKAKENIEKLIILQKTESGSFSRVAIFWTDSSSERFYLENTILKPSKIKDGIYNDGDWLAYTLGLNQDF